MNEPRVVALQGAHLPACAAIVDQSELFGRYHFAGSAAAAQLGAALDDPRAMLLAALDGADGRVVGFAWVVLRGAFDRSAYLKLIAVEQASHGRGVGRRLMEAIERQHLSRGIVLLVTADNHAAMRFYERLGYRCLGELPGYVRPELDERVYFKSASG